MDVKVEKTEVDKSISLENKCNFPKYPPLYFEIYSCYTSKDYQGCLNYIDQVTEDHIEYEILRSACLIHQGTKVSEAHKILDVILSKEPKNAYTIYAKGLAYYHEQKYQESVIYFEEARFLDSSSDMIRADLMMEKARAKINDIAKRTPKPVLKAKSSVKRTPKATKTDSPVKLTPTAIKTKSPIKRTPPQLHNKHSPPSSGRNVRRFGCEICNHFFGKKYNLDRHNRTLHNRDTPENFPTSSKQAIAQSKKISTIPISSPEISKKWEKVDDKMANCPTCDKMFKKGSLARHVIIHSGNKEHQCPYCTMAFFQKSDLARHLATHSDELQFECDLCDRKFRIKKNLQVHKRRHHSS